MLGEAPAPLLVGEVDDQREPRLLGPVHQRGDEEDGHPEAVGPQHLDGRADAAVAQQRAGCGDESLGRVGRHELAPRDAAGGEVGGGAAGDAQSLGVRAVDDGPAAVRHTDPAQPHERSQVRRHADLVRHVGPGRRGRVVRPRPVGDHVQRSHGAPVIAPQGAA